MIVYLPIEFGMSRDDNVNKLNRHSMGEEMGLDHEFLLLDKRIYPLKKNMNYTDVKCRASLNDDLVSYMNDTLSWIPASKDGGENGLNYYNSTLINQRSAPVLKVIIDSWFALFSSAPSREFELISSFSWNEKNKIAEHSYKLIYSKCDILPALKTISNMAEVVSQDDNFYILHLGI